MPRSVLTLTEELPSVSDGCSQAVMIGLRCDIRTGEGEGGDDISKAGGKYEGSKLDRQ